MHVPRTHRSTLLKHQCSVVRLRSTQALVQTHTEKTRKLPHPIHPCPRVTLLSSLTALLVVLCCTGCMVYSTAMRIPSPSTLSFFPCIRCHAASPRLRLQQRPQSRPRRTSLGLVIVRRPGGLKWVSTVNQVPETDNPFFFCWRGRVQERVLLPDCGFLTMRR